MTNGSSDDLSRFRGAKLEDTYFDRDVERAFMKRSEAAFLSKTKPSLYIANLVGNMYTPSVYCGLVSLLVSRPLAELAGNKIGVFSYGSGLTSSMYSISVARDAGPDSALGQLVAKLAHVRPQLESRRRVSPADFSRTLDERERNSRNSQLPFVPKASVEHMFPGTFYLAGVDDKFRRTYERTPSQPS